MRGKSVIRLLAAVAALTAASVVPAAADPISLAVAAVAAASAAGTVASALAISWGAAFAITFAANVALGFLAEALSPKPRTPNLSSFASRASGRTQQVRQPITVRRLLYGEARVSGPLVFIESTNNDQHLHMVIALAAHEVESIDEVYLNDIPIYSEEMDGDGDVNSGFYSGSVRIRKFLGTDDQDADPDLVSATSATETFRGLGIAYVYVRLIYNQDKFPGIPNVSAWVKGRKLLDPRTATTYWNPNSALAVYDYLRDTSLGMGFDADEFDGDHIDAAASVCDEIVDTVHYDTRVSSVDASLDILEFDSEILYYQTGDRIEITTTGTAPGGLATGTSYYVIARRHKSTDDIKTAIQVATTYDNALAGSEIDITSGGSGTHTVRKTGEPRYTANGIIETDQEPYEIIEELVSSMAGAVVHVGDTWKVFAGEYRVPTIELDEEDIHAVMTVQTRHSRRTRFNAVKGVYVSPINLGHPSDYPVVTDANFEEDDNNTRIWTDLDVPFTSRPHTAQRMARIHLRRHRQEITCNLRCGLRAFQVQAGDTLMVTNSRLGWSQKAFEVMSHRLVVDTGAGDAPRLACEIALRELASNVYDWDTTDETSVDPAPNTNLPSAFISEPPENLVVTSGNDALFLKADGTVVSRIKLEWDSAGGAFLEQYEIAFKRSSESEWQPVGRIGGDETQAYIWDVEDGLAYDVRIRAINYVGVRSEWTSVLGHTVVGKTAPPSNVTTFNVTRLADGTRRFVWTHIPQDADVRTGGGYEIRYRLGTGHVWDDLTPMHTGLLRASPHETNELAAGSYTFGIKAVDSSDNESVDAIIIEAVLGDPRLREVLVSVDEYQEGWQGDKTDCFVNHEGFLEATGSETWNDLPSAWSSLEDTWLATVDSNSPIEYTSEEIDLGLDISFTPIVSVNASGTATITMQTGDTADGSATGSFVSLASVNDVRYIKFRVSVSGTTPIIFSMVSLLDAATQIEDYEDVDTSASTAGRFERIATGHFKLATRGDTAAITQASIRAFQNAGSGWTWELLSKATTITGDSEPAAEFKIYQNGTLTDATIDVEIKGPKAS